VYGRSFTWTRMVDFNALIVWKTFIEICCSIKSSLWALTAAYTKFRRMIGSIIWSCATGHVPRCVLLPHRNAGRLHLEKLKAYNFVISGWVRPLYRCWSAILVTTAMTQPPPLHSPIFPPTLRLRNDLYCVEWGVKLYSLTHSLRLLPLPLFNEGVGVSRWENCGIKDVCRYVLHHFGGLVRLIIFPWNKKNKFPRPISLVFLSPEDFRDAFCVAGDVFGRPWLRWIRRLTRRTQDLQWRGFTSWGMARGLENVSLPVGSRGRAPAGVLDEVPLKQKQNVKLVYNF